MTPDFQTEEQHEAYVDALLEERATAQDKGHVKALDDEFARLGIDENGEPLAERVAGAGKANRLRGRGASTRAKAGEPQTSAEIKADSDESSGE